MEQPIGPESIQGNHQIIDELQKKQRQQIEMIETNHNETILGLIRSYEKQLKEKQKAFESKQGESEALYQEIVLREINRLKSSWTWKIGFFVTASARLAINFIKNPVKFLSSHQYRWRDIYFYNLPAQLLPVGEKNVEQTPVSSTVPAGDYIAEINPALMNFVCVLDTFTKSCFAPEFNTLTPTPESWKKVFDNHEINGVFVESAWHGNDNTWEGMTYNFGNPKGLDHLTALLSYTRQRGIPGFFWNKEDPVHYTRFLETARLFEYVFTSDGEILDKYKEALGHQNVYALPFAAQNKIHNPVRNGNRNKNVSFAGSYYNFTFAERKIDLDLLLQPSLEFGLEIYDRNYGATGLAAEEYKFPAMYQKAIKGKLAYSEMLRAYRTYKVFLNVNSVKYSSTMFARRVFELLACGTPVISNYSKGIINILGEGTVFITESESQTREYLEKLIGDEHFWWKNSLSGMRTVMEGHTYEDRTAMMFGIMGIPFKRKPYAEIIVIAPVADKIEAERVAEMMSQQTQPPSAILFIVPETFIAGNQELVTPDIMKGITAIVTANSSLAGLEETVRNLSFTHAALVSPEHFYGRNYLRDYLLALRYSPATMLGKRDTIRYRDNKVQIGVMENDYRWGTEIIPATLLMARNSFFKHDLKALLNSAVYKPENLKILTLDPWNFLPDGGKLFDKEPESLQQSIGI